MPKFFYLMLLGAFLFWGAIVLFVFNIRPSSITNILALNVLLFFAFGFSAAVPLCLHFRKKHGEMITKHLLVRKTLKWAFFISFGVTSIAVLKAFTLINLITLPLFLLLYLVLFHQIRYNR